MSHGAGWIASPSAPLCQFLPTLPSVFMCPIGGSMALPLTGGSGQ
ncbi:hypothetical protein [Achromobacter sp. UMC71]|nr:hypothetical protein [Achromobacter sp. UMC71]